MSLHELLKGMEVPAPPRSKQRGSVPGFIAERCNRWLGDRPNLSFSDLIPHGDFLARQVKYHFIRQFTETRYKWRIRPSAAKCLRLECLKRSGKEGKMDPAVVGTFFAGDFAEAYGITIALLAGCRLDDFQLEVEVPVPHGPPIKGHIDCTLTRGKKVYIVDFKSISAFGFKKVGPDYEDTWGYRKQLKRYMIATPGASGGLLVFINKGNWREFKEVVVPRPTDRDVEEWNHWVTTLQGRKVVDRPEWATTRTMKARKPEPHELEVLVDVRCKLCSHVEHCFGDGWYERGKEVVRDV